MKKRFSLGTSTAQSAVAPARKPSTLTPLGSKRERMQHLLEIRSQNKMDRIYQEQEQGQTIWLEFVSKKYKDAYNADLARNSRARTKPILLVGILLTLVLGCISSSPVGNGYEPFISATLPTSYQRANVGPKPEVQGDGEAKAEGEGETILSRLCTKGGA